MKIAAYLDSGGVPVSLYRPGLLHVYEDDDGGRLWQQSGRLPFRLEAEMSLGQVKAAIAALVDILGDCRVLLSGEVRGLPYSVLQEQHEFRTWKSEGSLEQQLDYVRNREQEAAARKKYEIVLRANQPVPAPLPVHGGAPGHFWIDLRAALEHPSNPTSRNVLIPFLSVGRFVQLEILCGHLPKWMAWEFERLDLAAESEALDVSGDGLRVRVYSRQAPEGRRRRPGLIGVSPEPGEGCRREARQGAALPAPGSAGGCGWKGAA